MRVDSHQHFWKYDPVAYDWISDDMEVIKNDFSPAQLKGLLKKNNFQYCMAVQSEQSEEHNSYLLSLAEKHGFIAGVVGWVDLQSEDIADKLEYLRLFTFLKGFRHILQGEKQRDMMLQPAFINGLKQAGSRGFTYDILVFPDQLPYVIEMVRLCPDQKFVLDHLGKPYIKKGEIEGWRNDIQSLAAFQNVYCKISGMVTEADWKKWRPADLVPYIDVVVQNFGTDRILFGSDWPVCLLAAEYDEVAAIMEGYFSFFSEAEQQNFFGGNAARFYNLKIENNEPVT